MQRTDHSVARGRIENDAYKTPVSCQPALHFNEEERVKIDLEALGMTQEDLQQKVVAHLAHDIMTTTCMDDEGQQYDRNSEFGKKLHEAVRETIDKRVNQIAEDHVAPRIAEMIDEMVLTKTNEWGEKKDEPLTFTEYLVSRAEQYMTEEVDYEGKTRRQVHGYSWKADQTRLAHMINKHLHYAIESAAKEIVKGANEVLVKGLAETVKLKLEEIKEKLVIQVR